MMGFSDAGEFKANYTEIYKLGEGGFGTVFAGCLYFLQMCLNEDPEKRGTLEQLKLHPWLHSLGLLDNQQMKHTCHSSAHLPSINSSL
ncbi:hypothetical protein PAMA_000110 [Pampus argenteus]